MGRKMYNTHGHFKFTELSCSVLHYVKHTIIRTLICCSLQNHCRLDQGRVVSNTRHLNPCPGHCKTMVIILTGIKKKEKRNPSILPYPLCHSLLAIWRDCFLHPALHNKLSVDIVCLFLPH